VAFNTVVTEQRPPRPLLELSASDSYDPTAMGIGGTKIATGLEAAVGIVERFLGEAEEGDVPSSAVVLVMSDGEDSEPEATLAAAARLKEHASADLAACLFATKGQPAHGAQLLRAIVSEQRLYQTVYGAEQLRKFFHASITQTAGGGQTVAHDGPR
jgi:hypothetical protein